MRNNASLLYSFFLIIGDFLALLAAFVTAYVLRVSLDARPLVAEIAAREYFIIFLTLLPFWLIIFALIGLYSNRTYENRFREFGKIIVGVFIGLLFVISYAYISNTEVFPARLVTAYSFLLALAFVLLFRTTARIIRRGLFNYGIGVNRVLIVGETPITRQLVDMISNTKITGYRVAGVVGPKPKEARFVHYKTFQEAIEKLHGNFNSIVQTELFAAPTRNSEILTYAQENHVSYRFVPGNSEVFTGKLEVDLFYSIPVVAVHQTALVGWGRIVKRLFDIFVGGIMLILALPFMIIISLLILIFDFGPILYRQERLSRFNSKVKIFKFRSMKRKYSGPLPEEAFTMMGRPELIKEYRENGNQLDNDPRISRLGRILRASSLDELPQLINVVKGDISLVGPRALVERELSRYDKKNLILSVKSGMTGLAVISGRSDLPVDERRKLDLYYVQNWSFWGDIVILARTISVVLFHKGAK